MKHVDGAIEFTDRQEVQELLKALDRVLERAPEPALDSKLFELRRILRVMYQSW